MPPLSQFSVRKGVAQTKVICPKMPLTALASSRTTGDDERNKGRTASSDSRPKMTRMALWLYRSHNMPAGMDASADARNPVSNPMWST
jgi:hypothetical protein